METKNNKKIIAIICIVLALAVALIAGVLVIQATPAGKVKRQIKLAEKYLTEMNYEQALIAYSEAIKIDPKCEQAYLAMADIYIKQGEAEKAIAILEEGQKNIQTDAMTEKIEEAKKQASSAGQSQQQSGQNDIVDPINQPLDDGNGSREQSATQDATEVAKTGIKSANVGEYITFGSYEQDGNTGNGAEPIEWLVLDNQGDRMLVISKYGLDRQHYNSSYTSVTWETCTLRNWLNSEFYSKAFNDNEKESVITTKIENIGNDTYGSEGGNVTDDKVFCLSVEEAERYFESIEARELVPTTYAIKNGVYDNNSLGKCSWWLRTPGYKQNRATVVNYDGKIRYSGHYVDYHGSDEFGPSMPNHNFYAVRPALWVRTEDISSFVNSEADTQVSTDNIISSKVGETITLGSYEQDCNGKNGAEPIEWIVLDNQGDKMLVISKLGLDYQPYNIERTDITWEMCSLRRWLNSSFYDKAFSESEKELILEVVNENADNAAYGTQGGNQTNDKVFLLSIDEASRYFVSDESRTTQATAYSVSKGSSSKCAWWLRSPGDKQNNSSKVGSSGYIAYLNKMSGVYGNGTSSKQEPDCSAVRPALWIAVNP